MFVSEIEQYYDSEYDEDYEYPLVTLGDCGKVFNVNIFKWFTESPLS